MLRAISPSFSSFTLEFNNRILEKNNDGKVLMIMNRINRILYGEKSLSLVCIDQENS